MGFTFSKKERLSDGKEIKRVFSCGKVVKSTGLRFLYLPNGKAYNRALFSVVRGYGKSVLRNKARRIGKEIYRTTKTYLSIGYDVVFLFYPGECDYYSRKKQILKAISRSGLLDAKYEDAT